MTWVKCWQCGGDHFQRDCTQCAHDPKQWNVSASGKFATSASLPLPSAKPTPKTKVDTSQSEVAERNSLATIKAQKQSLAKLKTPESRDALRDLAREEKGLKIRLSRRKDDVERLGVLEKLIPTLMSAIDDRRRQVTGIQERILELEAEVADNESEATDLRARIEQARVEKEQAEAEADAIDSASANVQPSFTMREVSGQRQDDVAYLMEQNRMLQQQMQMILAQNRLLQGSPVPQTFVTPDVSLPREPLTPVGHKASPASEVPEVPEMPLFAEGSQVTPVAQDPYSSPIDHLMGVPEGFSDGLSDGDGTGGEGVDGFHSTDETGDGLLGAGLRALGVKNPGKGAGRRSPTRTTQKSMQPFSRAGAPPGVKKRDIAKDTAR